MAQVDQMDIKDLQDQQVTQDRRVTPDLRDQTVKTDTQDQ